MVSIDPSIIARHNNVLNVHPPNATNHLTTNGSNWLWAVMALHGLLFLVVLALTLKTPHRQRVLHYIALGLLLLPTISYYTMASNLGNTPIPVQFRENAGGIPNRTRQIFWVRWVESFITMALQVIALLLITGIGWTTIIFTVAWVWVYTVMHLVGALTRTSYKWGYYAFGVLAYLMIAYQLLVVATRWANRFDTKKWFGPLSAYLVFLWLLYPIAWGLSEGGNRIGVTGEHIFYGILDILSKGLFALALVFFVAKTLDYKRLGLWMHDHGRVSPYNTDAHIHGDKARLAAGRDSGVGYDGYDGRGSTTVPPATTTATTARA